MKGQRLFVRRAAGAAELDSLPCPAPPSVPYGIAWVGFLVGRVVAVATAVPDGDVLVLTFLGVESELQRKRVGTVMLREIERDGFPARLEVRNGILPDAFLSANGYQQRGERFARIESEVRE